MLQLVRVESEEIQRVHRGSYFRSDAYIIILAPECPVPTLSQQTGPSKLSGVLGTRIYRRQHSSMARSVFIPSSPPMNRLAARLQRLLQMMLQISLTSLHSLEVHRVLCHSNNLRNGSAVQYRTRSGSVENLSRFRAYLLLRASIKAVSCICGRSSQSRMSWIESTSCIPP